MHLWPRFDNRHCLDRALGQCQCRFPPFILLLALVGALMLAGCGPSSSAAETSCEDWINDGGNSLGIDETGVVDQAYFEKFDQDQISVDFLAEQNRAVARGCEANPDSSVGDHLIAP